MRIGLLRVVHYYNLFRHSEFSPSDFRRGEIAIVLPSGSAAVYGHIPHSLTYDKGIKGLIVFDKDETSPLLESGDIDVKDKNVRLTEKMPVIQYSTQTHSLHSPEPEKYHGFTRLRKFFNKEHRRLSALKSRRIFEERKSTFVLRIIEECTLYNSIEEFTRQFTSAQDMNLSMRKLYITCHRLDEEEAQYFMVGSESPEISTDKDSEPLFLSMMKEKPKTFLKVYRMAQKVKVIDFKGFFNKLFRRKKNGQDGSEVTETTAKSMGGDPKANSGDSTEASLNDQSSDGGDTEGNGKLSGLKETPEVSLVEEEQLESGEGSDTKERVLFGTTSMLHLSDFKYRSNLSMRRGKFVVTDQKIITYRRRFSFLPSLPFFAFVRLNNRMVALAMQILSRVKLIWPMIKASFRTFGAAILGILIVFWDSIKEIIPHVTLPDFPGLPEFQLALSFSINYAIENPAFVTMLAGIVGGLGPIIYRVFRLLFMRSRAVTVITPEMVVGIGTIDEFRRGKRKDPTLILKPMGTSKLPRDAFGFRMLPKSKSPVEELRDLDELNLATLGLLAVSGWFKGSKISKVIPTVQ